MKKMLALMILATGCSWPPFPIWKSTIVYYENGSSGPLYYQILKKESLSNTNQTSREIIELKLTDSPQANFQVLVRVENGRVVSVDYRGETRSGSQLQNYVFNAFMEDTDDFSWTSRIQQLINQLPYPN